MLGLNLAGGGSSGILQAGFIKAFFQLGLNYDVLFGASVGTLNGILVHQEEIDLIEKLWREIRTKDVYRWYPWDIFKPFGEQACLYDSSPLDKLIARTLKYDKLRANPKPFLVATTDLTNKTRLTLDVKDLEGEKETLAYLKGSASPPVYFQPQNFRGTQIGDGGLANNFGIVNSIKAGCDTVVILYPKNYPIDPKVSNIMEALGAVTSIPSYAYLETEVQGIEKVNEFIDLVNIQVEHDYKKIKLVLIRPDKKLAIDLLDFNYRYDRKELMDYAFALAYTSLQKALC